MNNVQQLIHDLNAQDGPFFLSIKTVDGAIQTGAVVSDIGNELVLDPTGQEHEGDLSIRTYFNMAHIVSAWEAR